MAEIAFGLAASPDSLALTKSTNFKFTFTPNTFWAVPCEMFAPYSKRSLTLQICSLHDSTPLSIEQQLLTSDSSNTVSGTANGGPLNQDGSSWESRQIATITRVPISVHLQRFSPQRNSPPILKSIFCLMFHASHGLHCYNPFY